MTKRKAFLILVLILTLNIQTIYAHDCLFSFTYKNEELNTGCVCDEIYELIEINVKQVLAVVITILVGLYIFDVITYLIVDHFSVPYKERFEKKLEKKVRRLNRKYERK